MLEQQLIESIGRSNAELMHMVIEPAAARKAVLERELEREREQTTAARAHGLDRRTGWRGRIGARLHALDKNTPARPSDHPRHA